MLIKSVSGIRGIVGNGLNPEIILKFAAKFGEFISHNSTGEKKIIVGRDSRISGTALKNAVISGLLGIGIDVIDIDLTPTPTLLYNVKKLKAMGGIVITASHNTDEWNALKLVNHLGEFLSKDESEKFLSMEKDDISWSSAKNYGELETYKEAVRNHIRGVLSISRIDAELIKKKKFKIALDCVNGGASLAFQEFLNALNVEIFSIFCDASGEFKRIPEPRAENLESLAKKVKESGADAGFATDPDGDRISLVSEEGIPIGEEYTIALATKAVLSKKKGPVVVNLSTTKSVEDIAKRAGVPFYRSPVGEANVVKVMKEKNAVIGGEGNGGVINPEIQYTRDGMVAMALILQYLAEEKKPLSDIVNGLPRYKMIKEAVKMKGINEGKKLLEKIKNTNKEKNMDLRDGIRLIESDCWVHVRMSGTEPILRIIAEAPTIKKARALVDRIKNQGAK
ncbi:phosphoglucosamine mutase [candidate division WOR-3 bacterium]|nr:phosphoglucosamine mutase [candidate division WOR-3 bacterium]